MTVPILTSTEVMQVMQDLVSERDIRLGDRLYASHEELLRQLDDARDSIAGFERQSDKEWANSGCTEALNKVADLQDVVAELQRQNAELLAGMTRLVNRWGVCNTTGCTCVSRALADLITKYGGAV